MDSTGQTSRAAKRRTEAASRKRERRLQVYRSWCKRCGICVAFCPKQALARDPQGYPQYRDPKACVGCRMCELRCPDFAIEVVEEDRGDAPGK